MKDIAIKFAKMVPSKGITPEIIEKQFIWRKTGKYEGKSEIVFALMEEPIWWNRPLDSDILVKQEEDGLYSYNLPSAFQSQAWKSAYNVLLNKNNIPIAAMIKLNPKWSMKQRTSLEKLFVEGIRTALIELGVDSSSITYIHNDLLLNGKKFYGLEQIEKYGWLSINCFITLQYKPEKEIFDRLTGEHTQKRGITGIIEETGLFTKEEFMNKLLEKINEVINTLD